MSLPVPPIEEKLRPAEGRWLWIGLIVVAAIFLVGFSMFVFGLLGTIDKQNQELVTVQRVALEQRSRIDSLERISNRQRGMARVLSARSVRMVTLTAVGAGGRAYGMLYWDPERGAGFLQVTGLPPAPEEKEYRIWVAAGGRVSDAGVLKVTDPHSAFFIADHLPLSSVGLGTVTLTLEPKGGGHAPTSSPLLVGTSGSTTR